MSATLEADRATASEATPSSETIHQVIRRNGSVTAFDPAKIKTALTKAFLAAEGETASGSHRVHDIVDTLAEQIASTLLRRTSPGRPLQIEDIQDQVELALMRSEHHKVARAYVLYREDRARERAKLEARKKKKKPDAPHINVTQPDGSKAPLDFDRLHTVIAEACGDLESVSGDPIFEETRRNLYDGVTTGELALAPIMAARTLVEREPNYAFVSARLLLDKMRAEALSFVAGQPEQATQAEMSDRYATYFPAALKAGIKAGLIDGELARFDLKKITAALRPERDLNFQYLGLQTLYDRYFLHVKGARFELPQAFFMRVAMGLAIREVDREAKAIEFYDQLSTFSFMASTPTLFNAGTCRPQLSSCFLTTVPDDLDGIFKAVKDNALLAKYSGGLGNDWTPVRGLGAHIKGTNGESQGVVPFLKVANDTAIAVNQGGKRKGAVCAYLETWHIDIEEFLDLRKNTGDDRRRTHDMNTANWVPDLFMERVIADGPWTLFSPDDTPDLHDLYGPKFKAAYEAYEEQAKTGKIANYKTVRAVDLWRRMLTMLFETGHPWITFKDPCNIRSPQGHRGVVHSSNLCTEITLNTSADEVAVCNLGSINLAAHVTENGIDQDKLAKTVKTAMRMLDNVIDINFYTIPEARYANLRHRPVGLGLMGFQDALQKMKIPYASDEAVAFADESMEAISFNAISASVDLASERGRYESFDGSLWSRGILPIDSLDLLAETRAEFNVDRSMRQDWATLRERVKTIGMRNSNTMAIAPTATISNICGVSQSIEPSYRNLFVKSNMSGDFTVVNAALVNDLKERGLWDEVMISDLKYYDGSVGQIDRIPDDLKALYATAFELDSSWLIEAASRRQKWLDQAQSLNLYIANPSGKKLDDLYRLAWLRGLKTTYYLRSSAATHVEKSTLKGTDGRLNAVVNAPAATAAAAPSPTATVASAPPAATAAPIMASPSPVPAPSPSATPAARPAAVVDPIADGQAWGKACLLDDPECEACQ
ncbi:ribonucleoside-diphosphate reductase subunit alpha [Thalassospira lucentensis]|uniref:ribonucleoside-diphosphate reductase subunit alpha n=1 Tax=Thalassospira lucentensis TaxID=168935 RepID=UPI00142E0C33|nr:ribonucleoside-diphosphate reductase subunit alpha [Thalassospira lucentensis]NIZ03902.1 ribonucleoside-diphosphate reductase subunit alpha [Thalassospira lucentensis]